MRSGFIERRGKIADLDRSFDLQFWQAQPAKARFAATWELIQHAWRVKGHNVRQLRLQRSVETFQAWQHRVEVDFDDLVVQFISRDDLIRAKKVSGRPQDLIDVDLLSRPNNEDD